MCLNSETARSNLDSQPQLPVREFIDAFFCGQFHIAKPAEVRFFSAGAGDRASLISDASHPVINSNGIKRTP